MTAGRKRGRIATMALALAGLAALLACDASRSPAGPTPVPCSYRLSPAAQSFPSEGGPGSVTLTTEASCTWSIVGATGWVVLSSSDRGTGPAVVSFGVVPNETAAQRVKTFTVGDQPFTVTQAGRSVCTFAVSATRLSFDDSGGTARADVTTASECAWQAASAVPWVVVTGAAQGQGQGSITFSVQENNTSAARTGTLTVAGHALTIEQAGEDVSTPSTCEYTVTPPSLTLHWHGSYGGQSEVRVATQARCTWTSSAGASWIALLSGRSGTGSGAVGFSVTDFTEDGTRRAPLHVRWPTASAGQNVWIDQEGCRYGLQPGSASVGVSGGAGQVMVLSQAVSEECALGCPWTARSETSWIHITSGGSGSGDNPFQYRVDANGTGSSRVGTVRVQGQTFTITQPGS